jgi:D-3-phosphoglycerate dehydrogenase
MAKILITDGMAEDGVQALQAAGHEVDLRKVTADELLAIISKYDALAVRSATTVTPEVLAAGSPRLQLVGRAGVGVDNIDLDAATKHGVVVMNAPLGNILSAAEHTLGMLFAVARNIPQAHHKLQNGTWDKKSHIGVELQGKTLAIIGLGKIGKHVSQVAQAAGMRVIAFDPFLSREVANDLGIESLELEDCFKEADFITVHTPLTDKTKNMINADSIALMKPSVRLINVARGGIIDEDALADALQNGRVAAAALDVFASEPLGSDSPLLGLPNCITTPHLGASTEEAQVKVSTSIADDFTAFFEDGSISNAVNVRLKVDPAIDDYLAAAEQLARAVAQVLDEPLRSLEIRARGDLAQYDIRPLGVAALKGALSEICEENVNLINAQSIAEDRGITMTISSTESLRNNLSRLALKATTRSQELEIGGAIISGALRILRFGDYAVDLPIGGHVLILEYPDRPGMVGTYGSLLGDAGVNIARMEVSRIDGKPNALVVLTLDDPIPTSVIEAITTSVNPERLHAFSL